MIHRNLMALWGSGTGPLLRLSHVVRLLSGAGLFVSCAWIIPGNTTGFAALLVLVIAWIFLAGTPRPVWGRMLLYGFLIFAPFFLLVPWIDPSPAFTASREGALDLTAFRIPWWIMTRGIGGMLIAVATVSALSLDDFHKAVNALPLPHLAAALLVQMVHQAGLLFDETASMSRAILVRGGASEWRTRVLLLRSVPAVWLSRMMFKAERVAAAMEVRGFTAKEPRNHAAPLRMLDRATLAGIVLVMLMALALRMEALI